MNEQDVSAGLLTLITSSAKQATEINQMVSANLAQGLGVVNTTLIQQHGGVADDPAVIAALQTANRVPAGQ
jgi:hypothetical protein